MEQKIPNISDDDIKRIIERDFSELESNDVINLLERYKSESVRGRNRVFASVLKLSCGDVELIGKLIGDANRDYRNVIALAEYPSYSVRAFDDSLSLEEKKRLIDADWMQYETWFNKE